MKTKMNKTNKKSIKSRFINNIALTLVLSMTVFVACQKEVGIVPNPSPAAKSGVANKEVAFNPGIYDQTAGDPLFTAYYLAAMQLKVTLYDKVGEVSMDKHLGLLEAAIENNNMEQVAELMGYESLDCYTATVASMQAAASKLFKKYPSIHPDNAGAFERVVDVFFEKYESNIINPAARLGGSNSLMSGVVCGSSCKSKGQVPDPICCKLARKDYEEDVWAQTLLFEGELAICAGIAIGGSAGTGGVGTPPAVVIGAGCAGLAGLHHLYELHKLKKVFERAMRDCCKDKDEDNGGDDPVIGG